MSSFLRFFSNPFFALGESFAESDKEKASFIYEHLRLPWSGARYAEEAGKVNIQHIFEMLKIPRILPLILFCLLYL